MTPIDIRPADLATVRRILRDHVPAVEVLAFGSRVAWKARETSDLDLALMTDEPLGIDRTAGLRAAFTDSDLPFRVDIVDWATTSENFRRRILADHVVLRVQAAEIAPPTKGSTAVRAEATGRGDRGGWRETILGDVITLKRGYDLPQNQRVDGPVPVVSSSGITDHHHESRVSGPGVVTGRYGTLGRVFFIPDDFWPLNTALYVRDFQGNDPRFISYFLRSLDFSACSDKAAVPGVNRNHLHEEPVRVPASTDEQRAIAHILGTLDDKIELNRRMNATLEAMARALFRSWFVDFDPVRAKMEGRDTGLPKEVADLFPDRLVDSELGEIPEGWPPVPLPELMEVNPSRSLRRGEIAPYLDMANMPTRGHAPDSVVRRPFTSGMRFANGDTLVARITPCLENGKTAYVDFLRDDEVAWGSTEYIVMKPRHPFPGEFAYLLARTARFREFAIQNMSGTSGRQRVPASAFAGFLTPSPPELLGVEFGQAVRLLLGRATAAVDECRVLANCRDALLPKLVSGEVRVPDAEKLAGALPDSDKPRRSGPTAAGTNERRIGDVNDGKSVPHVQLVGDIEAGILGTPPAAMRAGEIVWSRRTAIRDAVYRTFSEAQQNALLDEIMKWGTAHRHHAVLGNDSGEPAGSGVCVTSGGRRGILTARHVLSAHAEGKEWRTNLFIGFAPPQDEMIQGQRRREHGRQNSKEPLGPFQVTGISLGDRVTIAPLQRIGKSYPDPGLPDIAIIVVSDDIEERLRKTAHNEGTAVPEPRWVDLDREGLVSVPYGPTNDEDKMLAGSWLITGLRGERSDFKKFYTEMDGIAIDRIYKRSEYEYYGIFVDEVGGRRTQSRSWKGTSGGGVWQQGLRQSGWRKIEQSTHPSLTPDDLEPPVLGGIAFFHETRKPPQELRGDRDGTRCYRGELYAHRIGGTLLDLIRRALRHGATMVETGDGECASGEVRDPEGS